jgi:hypothetical protein
VGGPQRRQGAPLHRIDEVRGDVGQGLQHEGMPELGPWQLEVARTTQHPVVEVDDVDIQRARGEARHVAAAPVPVLQGMQPVVQGLRF